jgi:hypothetical protein
MKCTDFEHRLNQLLDDRLRPESDPQLLAHAEGCFDCREMLAAQESLFLGMAQLKRRSVSDMEAGFGPRVLSELNASEAQISLPPPARQPIRWTSVLSVSLAVLMAVSVGMWIVARNNRQNAIAQPPTEKDPTGLALIQPGGAGRTKEVSPPQTAPASQPGELAATPPFFSLQADLDGAMATITSRWQSSNQWHMESIDVEQYAPGIRPIRESFEVAIDALLKTIPPGKKESRPNQPQAVFPYGSAAELA